MPLGGDDIMNNLFLFIMVFFSTFTVAKSKADVALLADNSNLEYSIRELSNKTPANISFLVSYDRIDGTERPSLYESNACHVKFKDYFFVGESSDKEYFGKQSPITEWQCAYVGSQDILYGSEDGLESVVYNEDDQVILIRNDVTTDVKKDNHVPLEFYDMKVSGLSGYVVIDKNPINTGSIPVKLKFCIYNKTIALCGLGEMIRDINKKTVNFTPYVTKMIESVEFVRK